MPLAVAVEYQKENSNKVERIESTVNVNVLSGSEYSAAAKSNGGSTGLLGMILAVPALVVAYIVLWLVYKFVGVATNFLNRKLFKRKVE